MRQIITVATMKGGSGKSTLASCLAVHWHMCGRPSTIIDADPQRSIARLAAREKALGGRQSGRGRLGERLEDGAQPRRHRPDYHRHPRLPLAGDARLHRGGRLPAGPGQGLAARHRPHARYAQFAARGRRGPAALLPLRADADDAGFSDRQAHPRRTDRDRLSRCSRTR